MLFMKIPKEYMLLIIVGLYLVAYVLEATVDPLALDLATPYQYLSPTLYSQYPFSSAVIAIRALAVFLTPTFLLSFIKGGWLGKGGTLLIVAGLAQLYALQELVSGTTLLPLEWSLSLAFGSAALALPAVINLIIGLASSARRELTGDYAPPQESLEEQ